MACEQRAGRVSAEAAGTARASLTLCVARCFSGEVHLPQPGLAPAGARVPGPDQWQLPGPLLRRVALPDEQKAALRRAQGTAYLPPPLPRPPEG